MVRDPSENLFVKGIPWIFNDLALMEMFRHFGTVQRSRLMAPSPGNGDCTGLVRMSSVEEAESAIEALNGLRLPAHPDGHMMVVRYHGGKGGADVPPSDNLYVKGLPAFYPEMEVRRAFGSCGGTVVSVRVMPPRPPATDSTALVRMSSVEEAAVAISCWHGGVPPGVPETTLVVRYADSERIKQEKSQRRAMQIPDGVPPQASLDLGAPLFPWAEELPEMEMFLGAAAQEMGMAATSMGADESDMASMFLGEEEQPPPPPLQPSPFMPTTPFGRTPFFADQPPPPEPTPTLPTLAEMATAIHQPKVQQAIPPPRASQYGSGLQLTLEVRYHGPKGAPPSDNLYVRGLPPGTSMEELEVMFGSCGTVTSVRVLPPHPRARDAAALVRMSSVDEATYAIGMLNGAADHVPGPPMVGGDPNHPAAMLGMGGPHDFKAVPPPVDLSGVQPRFNEAGQLLPPSFVTGLSNDVGLPEVGSMDEAMMALNAMNGTSPNGVDDFMGSSMQMAPGGDGGGLMDYYMDPGSFLAEAAATGVGDDAAFGGSMGFGSLMLEVRYHGPRGAAPSDNLYVKGLPAVASEAEVRELFATRGTVKSVRVMPPRPPALDATALVRMGSEAEAAFAISTMSCVQDVAATEPDAAGAIRGGGGKESHRAAPY